MILKRFLFLPLCSLLFIGMSWDIISPPGSTGGFQFLTRDSILIDVYEYYDNAGLPEGYKARVTTPVCDDSLCYDANIILYWDLIGNFTRLQPVPGLPLTKADHVPFEIDDYENLSRILSTKKPTFVYLSKEQLVTKTGMDGITSATVASVKKDMIEGAIYTCYTLWHIANGDIVFPMTENTLKNLDSRQIGKMLASGNSAYHYFLVENLPKNLFGEYIPDLLKVSGQNGSYYASRIIDHITSAQLADSLVREAVLTNYIYFDQDTRIQLIKKLSTTRLDDKTLTLLMQSLTSGQTQLNNQIIQLTCMNVGEKAEGLLEELLQILTDRKIVVTDSSFEALQSVGSNNSAVNRLVLRFKRKYKRF